MNYVYMLRCADGTLYTGWTTDLTRRLAVHNGDKPGAAAKYTRSRRPVQLVWCESQPDRSAALRREAAIKAMPRTDKQALIDALPDGERLTVLDADDRPVGEMPRALVHRLGLRHAVCHLWLLQERDGVRGMWLQKRADDRPLYPGLYDLAATGHLDPGESPLEGALREAREEIGLTFPPERALPLGMVPQRFARPDGGFDDERVHAFAIRADDTPAFAPGPEVGGMFWVSLDEFRRAENGAPRLTVGGETVDAARLCCLHKGEWALFEKHLKNFENQQK